MVGGSCQKCVSNCKTCSSVPWPRVTERPAYFLTFGGKHVVLERDSYHNRMRVSWMARSLKRSTWLRHCNAHPAEMAPTSTHVLALAERCNASTC